MTTQSNPDRELERLNEEITKRVPPHVWPYINAYVAHREAALLSRMDKEIGPNETKANDESLSDHHRRSARNQLRKRLRRALDTIKAEIEKQ